ncbi:MAG: hypothetical protein NPIRA03_31090 [Nitrospirales bacterium]|nr:MAG: hypothetical protein NPIRA03_31090 [Nitrospirales bacterium]
MHNEIQSNTNIWIDKWAGAGNLLNIWVSHGTGDGIDTGDAAPG